MTSPCERPASSSFNDVGFSYGQTGEGAASNDAGQGWLHCTDFLPGSIVIRNDTQQPIMCGLVYARYSWLSMEEP